MHVGGKVEARGGAGGGKIGAGAGGAGSEIAATQVYMCLYVLSSNKKRTHSTCICMHSLSRCMYSLSRS